MGDGRQRARDFVNDVVSGQFAERPENPKKPTKECSVCDHEGDSRQYLVLPGEECLYSICYDCLGRAIVELVSNINKTGENDETVEKTEN